MVADRVNAMIRTASSIQSQPPSRFFRASCRPNTMTASSAANASRLELPTMPWIGPPSSNQLRDQNSISGSLPSGYSTQKGSTGWRTTSDTTSSNRIERARTSRSATPNALTISSQLNDTATATPAVTVIPVASTPSAEEPG